MKNAENINMRLKRRVPTAALIAAVLVVVLAGTALAGEYLGFFRLQWLSGFQTPEGVIDGYTVALQDIRFPAEELSDEVFAIGENGDVHRKLSFNSKAKCEEFLGVKLAANTRLGEMQIDKCWRGQDAAHVWLDLYYTDMLPSSISVDAYYRQYGKGGEISVSQDAAIHTQYNTWEPENWDYLVPQHGEETLEYEAYVMSNGIEALIIKETYDTVGRWGHSFTYDCCYAGFVKDNIRYLLSVSVRNNLDEALEIDALELTKEILDAYE